nr:MAG TPA_asm: hypothetical protein [Inoviridae sp.]
MPGNHLISSSFIKEKSRSLFLKLRDFVVLFTTSKK